MLSIIVTHFNVWVEYLCFVALKVEADTDQGESKHSNARKEDCYWWSAAYKLSYTITSSHLCSL